MRLIDADEAKRFARECWPNPIQRLAIDLLLDNAPTITQESLVVHGRWVRTGDGEWECSNCKEATCICDSGKDRTYRKPYCPNCGCKMREADDGAE